MIDSEENRLQHVLNHRLVKYSHDYVYVVKCQEFYKIGIAYDVKLRIVQMQIGNPYKLELVTRWRALDAIVEEEELHERYASYRKRGEWFALPDSAVIELIALSDSANAKQ